MMNKIYLIIILLIFIYSKTQGQKIEERVQCKNARGSKEICPERTPLYRYTCRRNKLGEYCHLEIESKSISVGAAVVVGILLLTFCWWLCKRCIKTLSLKGSRKADRSLRTKNTLGHVGRKLEAQGEKYSPINEV